MSVEALYSHINLLGQEAGYQQEFKEHVVCDNLIQCLKDEKVWDKIAWEGNGITLAKVLEIVHFEASTKPQMQMFHDMLAKQVDYLQYGPKFKKRGKGKGFEKDTANSTQGKAGRKTPKCFTCGKRRHQPDPRYPATNAVYRHCHTKGHFEVICQQKACSKKLHSLEDYGPEASTARRVLNYCDTTRNPV